MKPPYRPHLVAVASQTQSTGQFAAIRSDPRECTFPCPRTTRPSVTRDPQVPQHHFANQESAHDSFPPWHRGIVSVQSGNAPRTADNSKAPSIGEFVSRLSFTLFTIGQRSLGQRQHAETRYAAIPSTKKTNNLDYFEK